MAAATCATGGDIMSDIGSAPGRIFGLGIVLALIYLVVLSLFFAAAFWDWRVLPLGFALLGVGNVALSKNKAARIIGCALLVAMPIAWILTTPPDLSDPQVVQTELQKLRPEIAAILDFRERYWADGHRDDSSLSKEQKREMNSRTEALRSRLRKLAETRDADAMYWYAKFWVNSNMTNDTREDWLNWAIDKGHADAAYELARENEARVDYSYPSYTASARETTKLDNFLRAGKYYATAVSNGHKTAEQDLRSMFDRYPDYAEHFRSSVARHASEAR